jgi:hypothetical protein
LINDHDLSGLQWTDHVIVQFMVTAHSHPVLTMNTQHVGFRLLSTYVHEQLHWWVGEHPGLLPAMEDGRSLWPAVADQGRGGSKTEFSTRLHLIVCHLEHRAMERLVGPSVARSVLDAQIRDWPSYPWIRAQVQSSAPDLDSLCSLLGPLLPDGLSTQVRRVSADSPCGLFDAGSGAIS